MKKSIIAIMMVAIFPWAQDLRAQENLANLKNTLTPYGFFRTAAVFDSRDSKAGSEDLFYFVPMDVSTNLEGQDIYSNPSLKSYAITTRLGLDVSGYQYGSMKVGGKLETDFYLMNGSTASLRLRHAYVNIFWDAIGYMENKLSIKAGQSWHPMAADQPYCVNVETGAPFTPFNWSPEVSPSRQGRFILCSSFLPALKESLRSMSNTALFQNCMPAFPMRTSIFRSRPVQTS